MYRTSRDFLATRNYISSNYDRNTVIFIRIWVFLLYKYLITSNLATLSRLNGFCQVHLESNDSFLPFFFFADLFAFKITF